MASTEYDRRLLWGCSCPLAVLLAACSLCGCARTNTSLWRSEAPSQQEAPLAGAADRDPTPETLCATATLLAKQGRVAESEHLLARTLTEYRGYAPAYCNMAELYMRQGRVDGAIQVLAAGADATGRTPYLLNNLGVCWLAKGDYERALAVFTLAAGAVPENARYRANMATALGLLGRYEEALALFEQVVPPDEAQRNLAVLCETRKDKSRAAEARRTADGLRLRGDAR